MYKYFFLFSFVIISQNLVSQDIEGLNKYSLSVYTDLDGGSQKLSSKFIDKYVRGGYIDNETKDAFFSKLESKNRAGVVWDTKIELKKYSGNSDNKRRSYQLLGFENYYLYEAEFTNDLFGLYFYGNKRYENTKADLSDMRFKSLKFQVIKFGFYQQFQRLGFGLNGGLVLGQNYLTVETNKASIYTADHGQYLDLDINAKSTSSDFSQDKLFSAVGKGLSVDAKIDFWYQGNSKIGFELNRLGFIKWGENLKEQSVDTSYRFEGINISSIIDSFVIDLKSPEEFKDELVHSKLSEKRNRALPVQYAFNLHHSFKDEKLWLDAKLTMMPNTLYKTSFQCDLNYQFIRLLTLGVDAGVGGYSSWNTGINVGVRLAKFITVDLKARSLFNIYNLNKPAALIGSAKLVIGF